jgi:deoxyadenosine/deoxycytidine kinase
MMLYINDASTVVVIGPPGSGKSYVAHLLAENSGLPVYCTDKFLGDGHVAALYGLMQAVGDDGWIVEGMIGYRFLRKRKQLKLPAPDIVIQLDASDEQIARAYAARGKPCNIKVLRNFCAAHEKVMSDYLLLDGEAPKIWVHANSYHLCHLIGGGPSGTGQSEAST